MEKVNLRKQFRACRWDLRLQGVIAERNVLFGALHSFDLCQKGGTVGKGELGWGNTL